MDRYFELVSTEDQVVAPTAEWRRQVGKRVLCPDCGAVAPSTEPNPIPVSIAERPAASLVAVAGGVPIMHAALLEWLRNRGAELIGGQVEGPRGREQKMYRSYYSPRSEQVAVHLGPRAIYRVCPTCKRIATEGYAPPMHLVQHDIRDRRVLTDWAGCIFLRHDLVIEFPVRDFSDMIMNEMPVLSTPLDADVWPRQ